jgi:hypothetical protein
MQMRDLVGSRQQVYLKENTMNDAPNTLTGASDAGLSDDKNEAPPGHNQQMEQATDSSKNAITDGDSSSNSNGTNGDPASSGGQQA